jgi:hypothetical protein
VKAVSFIACLLVLALVGCKGGEANAVGKWKGEFKVPETSKDDPMAKMAEGLMSMFTFNLELMADHKYKLLVLIVNMEGDWSMKGNQITLTPTKIMGLSPEEYKKEQEKQKSANPMAKSGDSGDIGNEPLILEMQPNGTMKAILPGDQSAKAGGGDLIFTKQTS